MNAYPTSNGRRPDAKSAILRVSKGRKKPSANRIREFFQSSLNQKPGCDSPGRTAKHGARQASTKPKTSQHKARMRKCQTTFRSPWKSQCANAGQHIACECIWGCSNTFEHIRTSWKNEPRNHKWKCGSIYNLFESIISRTHKTFYQRWDYQMQVLLHLYSIPMSRQNRSKPF